MRHRSELGLAHVLPSAAAAVGVPGFDDDLGIGSSEIVVVCLIDGLGATLIEEDSDLFDSLSDAQGGSIEAAFPTTTPTGLATLGTGLDPGLHGIVGASFWLPEDSRILSPLHWGRRPTPEAVQPEPTVFERVAKTDVRAVTIAPQAYIRSGLTAAALRGSEYLAADSAQERAATLHEVCAARQPTLAYVYWAALDRAAHEFGIRSGQWRQAAQEVNDLLWLLRGELPTDASLVVTADHGMIDCEQRFWIEDHPRLEVGVRAIAGEPRMRHVYTRADQDAHEVAQRWRDVLADHACVMTRDEAIKAELFGSVDPGITERIGDVLALAQGGTIIASRRFDERVSLLRGHHGARSDAERRIPGLLMRA
jgi:predicted AlkP superfamily pyrophosphatase or phosphodiesterase